MNCNSQSSSSNNESGNREQTVYPSDENTKHLEYYKEPSELHLPKEMCQAFFNVVPVGLLVVEQEGTIKDANKHAISLLAEQKPDLQNTSIRDWIVSEDVAQFDHCLHTLFKTKSEQSTVLRLHNKKGKSITTQFKLAFLHPQNLINKTYIACFTISNEATYTEYFRSPASANGSQTKYEIIVENANSIIAEVNRDGILTYMNDYGLRFFGYSEEELIGKELIGTILPYKDTQGRKIRGFFNEIIQNPKKHLSVEIEHLKKSNAKAWILWKSHPLFDQNHRFIGLQGIGYDITNRKITELELTKEKNAWQKQAQKKDRELAQNRKKLKKSKHLSELGTMLSVIAHELRNPLSIIKISSYNIKHRTQDREIREQLQTIDQKVTDSEYFINNLLYYSKMKDPEYQAIDLVSLCNDCVKEAEQRYREKNIRVYTKIETLQYRSMQGDPYQLKEVFINILNNSYDAVPEEEGEIMISADLLKDEVEISISDNGPGINDELLEKITDPFFTTKSKGTGLGLYACQQIIEKHKGSLEIESEKGKGTTMIITLPYSPEHI